MLSENKHDRITLRFSDENAYEIEPQRYMAGTQFFNYETFGALREGGPVRLLSKEYFGLVVSVFFSNLVFCLLRSCVSPTLSNLLQMTPSQANAAQHLIEDLPACMCFFAGFVSDILPIRGSHRKPYMLLGWIWAAVMLFVMTAVMWFYETSISSDVYILLAMSVSFGTMLPYAQCEILLVELTQRESLQERGSLVARYQYVRILGNGIGKLVTIWLLKKPTLYQTQRVLIAVTCAALIPPVAIAFLLVEEYRSRDITWQQATTNLHKTAQQKVVWNIVVFVMIFSFFLNFEFPSGEAAIRKWSNITETPDKLITSVVQDVFYAVSILTWHLVGLNCGWPVTFLWCPLLKVLPSLALSLLTSTDTVRSQFLFWGMTALMGLSYGLTRIYLPVVLTEIVGLSNEGATVGLMLTFQKTLTMFVTTMAPKVSNHAGWEVTSDMIAKDTNDVRITVAKSLGVSYGVNFVSLVGLFFLPTQKLDAQQRRTYGGFTRCASWVLLVAFLGSFTYSLVVNVGSAYTTHSTSKWA